MTFDGIMSVAGTASSVKEFVEGGSLAVALREIGGIELDAAILCLQNIRQANNPTREVELAVGHLQSAHFAFQRLYTGRGVVTANLHEYFTKRAVAKVQQVNVMMAICYAHLSEPALLRQSMGRSEEAYQWMLRTMDREWAKQWFSGWNPLNYWGIIAEVWYGDRFLRVLPTNSLDHIRDQLVSV